MRIGAQLYTVRNYCKDKGSFAETLKKIADIGYGFVQVSGTCAYEAEWLRDRLSENGLKCVITHYNADAVRNDTEKVISDHKTFGSKLIGLGSIPAPFASSKDYEGFAAAYRTAAEKIAREGCYLMYHNHHFEFERDEKGIRGIEKLASSFSPGEMGFTLDTFWIQYGGGDPAEWIKTLSGRVPAIHVKDLSIVGGAQRMAVIGEGNINFDRVFYEAERAGTEYMLVEQDDCYGEDPFECLSRSFEYLRSCGFN